jgi:hypothetical protein
LPPKKCNELKNPWRIAKQIAYPLGINDVIARNEMSSLIIAWGMKFFPQGFQFPRDIFSDIP